MMIKAELRGIATGLAAAACAVLLAISVDVGVPGQDLLGSIRFHIALPMLAIPALLFVSGAWLRGVLMLLAVGASLGQGGLIIWQQQQARQPLLALAETGRFKILSYNVLSDNQRPDEAVQMILSESADLVVILEAPGLYRQLEQLQATYPYRVGCDTRRTCDTLLLSKTALDDPHLLPFGPFRRERLIVTSTVLGGQRVIVTAAHLSKPYFDEAAMLEIYQLSGTLSRMDGPVVLAGDFNSAAWSGGVNLLVQRADLIPPPRYPATWPVRAAEFGVPIDNIFTKGPALISDIAAIPATGSNHRGLVAHISLRGSPASAAAP